MPPTHALTDACTRGRTLRCNVAVVLAEVRRRQVMDINVVGSFNVMKTVANLMIETVHTRARAHPST